MATSRNAARASFFGFVAPIFSIVLVACAAATPARAGHAAAARLEKRIAVSFVETPLERAVHEIGRLANVAVVVDAKGLDEKKRRFPVSLQLAKAPAREALDLMAKDAGVGYSLDGHVVFVSTRAKARAGEIVLRSYDVRDLTYPVSNFPGPDYSLRRHESAYGGGLGLAGGAVCLDEPPPDAMVQSWGLADLIIYRIRPDEWGTEHGTSIEERDGFLVVVHVREVHEEVVAFLDDLRATGSLLIGLDTWAFLAEPPVIDRALAGAAAPGFLAPGEFARVVRGLLDRGAERLGSVRTVCMNNQRVHAMTGVVSSYLSDFDVSGSVLDPVVGQSFEGFNVDVAPIASHDRRFVTLTLTIAAPSAAGETATHTAVEGAPAVVPPKRKSEGAFVAAPARLQANDVAARDISAQVQVPRGHAAVFAVPAIGDRAAVFVVRPTIIGEPRPRQ